MGKYTKLIYDERVGCIAIYPDNLSKERTHCLSGADKWAIAYKHGYQTLDDKGNFKEWNNNAEDVDTFKRLVSCWNACLNLENPESDLKKLINVIYEAEACFQFLKTTKIRQDLKETVDIAVRKIDEALSLIKE